MACLLTRTDLLLWLAALCKAFGGWFVLIFVGQVKDIFLEDFALRSCNLDDFKKVVQDAEGQWLPLTPTCLWYEYSLGSPEGPRWLNMNSLFHTDEQLADNHANMEWRLGPRTGYTFIQLYAWISSGHIVAEKLFDYFYYIFYFNFLYLSLVA